jgi:hypothetical protein
MHSGATGIITAASGWTMTGWCLLGASVIAAGVMTASRLARRK